MKIYLLPGLGYDHRIFQRLKLPDANISFSNWIEPLPYEPIANYAERISEHFVHDQQPIVLIGHSLGGIVAQEIANIIPIEKIILIASIRSREELPFYFKMIKPLYMGNLFTKNLCLKTIKYWGKDHGFITESDQQLFKDMVGNQSNSYLKWAINTLSSWKGAPAKNNTKVIQIHGSNDKTFPIKHLNKVDEIVENGSHIFVYQKPEIASKLIATHLLS